MHAVLGRRRGAAALAAAPSVLLAVLLSGCGAAETATTPGAAAADATGLDAQLTKPGVLTVGMDITYPPMGYLEGGKPVGAEVDLLTDLAHRLGLEVAFVQTPFDDLIGTVAAGGVDVTASAMTDRAARQETIDFVDYFVAGTQAVVATGNPAGVDGPASWCGKRVAANSTSTNGGLAAAQSDLCVAAGKPAVTLVDTENGLSPAVVDAGGADVALEDYPSSAVAASDDTLAVDLSGTPLQAAPYGFGFAKDDTALRDAVQVALQESIADGTYAEILDAYALSAGSLRTTAINGGA